MNLIHNMIFKKFAVTTQFSHNLATIFKHVSDAHVGNNYPETMY